MDLSRGQFIGGVGALLVPGSSPRTELTRYRIGHSVKDRPITAYRIGPADAPSRYLVIGCMHGEEPAGTQLLREHLLRASAPRGVQLWLVPTVNPDGLAAGRRTNAHGVDLNRNFDGPHWKVQGEGTEIYSGPEPLSERETRVMTRFLTDLQPHTITSMHQPLACVDFSHGASREHTQWLSARLGLPARRLAWSGGNMTTWFNDLYPHKSAVTLELRRPTTAAMRRHTADVLVRHAAHRASG
jgi:murein peptide amidase A